MRRCNLLAMVVVTLVFLPAAAWAAVPEDGESLDPEPLRTCAPCVSCTFVAPYGPVPLAAWTGVSEDGENPDLEPLRACTPDPDCAFIAVSLFGPVLELLPARGAAPSASSAAETPAASGRPPESRSLLSQVARIGGYVVPGIVAGVIIAAAAR